MNILICLQLVALYFGSECEVSCSEYELVVEYQCLVGHYEV